MRTFKAVVEYDGTDFAGFQWQTGARTVQGVLEAAIEARTGAAVRLTGAGRTDSGVHAAGQVISFAADTRIPTDRMAIALNTVLPRDTTIRSVEEVDAGFSARFSASSRVYVYLILNRETPSALWRRFSAYCREPLNSAAMQEAALLLLGEKDFAAFTNELEPGKTTMREVMSCRIRSVRQLVMIRIEANAFLRGMVRNIVGTLMDVGLEKRSREDISAILHSRDRRMAGPSAPPQGLCLLKVRYGTRKSYFRSHEEMIEEST